MRVYIAGPMTGYKNFNREAFHKAEEELKREGHTVLNPAVLPDGLTQPHYMDICMAMIRCVDAIYMLKGWQRSAGAKAELALAEKLGHAVIFQRQTVSNQWRPDICPITGRAFFMWIEHPKLGNVPTYGGPLDSYTIPTKDSDGEFSCERYDHDFGGWVESECLGLYLIDDEEQCRVYELEERVKELEAREVHLPTRYGLRYGHPINADERHVMIPKENGCWIYLADLEHVLRVAGIRIKGEEHGNQTRR